MAQTITVSSSRELKEAFERLASGEGGTIRLEAASKPYAARLVDRNAPEVDAPVTITSADPSRPATIAQMTLVGRENVTIEGVVFDSREGERDGHHRDLELAGSKNIAVRDVAFRDGATETFLGSGQTKGTQALIVRNSEGVEVSDVTMEGYFHGMAFFDSDDVTLTGSEITRLQGDALRIAGMQDMLVQDNHLHSMLGSSQNINHSDMIQFWGRNIKQNTERVTISENVISTGDGPSYQMIFGHNDDRGKNGWLFEDITIEGNVLYGAHYNMIVVNDTNRMKVVDNTVLFNSDTHQINADGSKGKQSNGWIDIPKSRGTVIEGNLATTIHDPTGRNDLVRYEDPSHPDHFENNFVNLAAGGTAELQSLRMLPGSQWDRKLGSPLTWSNAPVDEITAIARPEVSGQDLSVVEFDASLSRAPWGRLNEKSASYVWTFDDGTVKRGARVTHDFEGAGTHGYALEVRSRGQVDRIEREIDIAEPLLLAIEPKGGKLRDASAYESKLAVKGGKLAGEGFVLDGRSNITVDRGSEQIYSLDAFALSMTFERASGATKGSLFALPEAMDGKVTSQGGFKVDLTTTEGRFTAQTKGGLFPQGEPRDLAVVYDGTELRIYADGREEAATKASGLTQPLEHWGLTIGHPWVPSVKGVVSDVTLSAEVDGAGAPPKVKDAHDAGSGAGLGGSGSGDPETLVALNFEGHLRDPDGAETRALGDVGFSGGSEGRGARIGEGSVLVARENDFLHEMDGFEIDFDVKRAGSSSDGRLIHFERVLDAHVSKDGTLAVVLRTDEGRFELESEGALSGRGWHDVEIGYDGAEELLRLTVDGETVEAQASGETAARKYWGLVLGSAWGDTLDATVDNFRLHDAPDWA
jgi:hypothetical protein